MAAPHGRSWMHYAIGILLHAVLFALVGPPIGAIVVSAVVGTAAVGDPRGIVFGPVFLGSLSFLSLGYAYFLGWKSAAATGAIVAITSSFVLDPRWHYVLASATGAISAVLLIAGTSEWAGWAVTVSLAAGGAAAALACTRLAAGLRLRRPGPAAAGRQE